MLLETAYTQAQKPPIMEVAQTNNGQELISPYYTIITHWEKTYGFTVAEIHKKQMEVQGQVADNHRIEILRTVGLGLEVPMQNLVKAAKMRAEILDYVDAMRSKLQYTEAMNTVEKEVMVNFESALAHYAEILPQELKPYYIIFFEIEKSKRTLLKNNTEANKQILSKKIQSLKNIIPQTSGNLQEMLEYAYKSRYSKWIPSGTQQRVVFNPPATTPEHTYNPKQIRLIS